MAAKYKGVYVGKIKHLQGETVQIQAILNGKVLAQFDSLQLTVAYGWRVFPLTDFKDVYPPPGEGPRLRTAALSDILKEE